jgi:hypothetical protein
MAHSAFNCLLPSLPAMPASVEGPSAEAFMFDMIDGGGKVTAKLKVASSGGLCGIWLILSGSSPTQPLADTPNSNPSCLLTPLAVGRR